MSRYIVTAFKDDSLAFEKKFDNATDALAFVSEQVQFDRENGLINYYYHTEKVYEE